MRRMTCSARLRWPLDARNLGGGRGVRSHKVVQMDLSGRQEVENESAEFELITIQVSATEPMTRGM